MLVADLTLSLLTLAIGGALMFVTAFTKELWEKRPRSALALSVTSTGMMLFATVRVVLLLEGGQS